MELSFGLLPLEIKQAICATLCPHCRADFPLGWKSQFDIDRRALAALSLTCKENQVLSKPFLYHRPGPIQNYSSFVKTLLHRPDLAEHVREYHSVEYWGDVSSEEDKKIIKDVALSLLLDTAEDPLLEKALEFEYKQLCAEIPIALAPNLERMITTIDPLSLNKITTYKFLEGRLARLKHQQGLKTLHCLRFKALDNYFFSMNNPNINALLRITPHLRDLTFQGTLGLESAVWSDFFDDSQLISETTTRTWTRALRHLRSLSFECSSLRMSPHPHHSSYFREMAALSPSLQSFRFHASPINSETAGQFVPRMFLGALDPCRTTLETLDLDFSRITTASTFHSSPSSQLLPSHFSPFTNLKFLKLDEESICKSLTGSNELSIEEVPASCVFDILSQLPKVECFLVRMREIGNSHTTKDLFLLGHEITCGKLPNFRKVELHIRSREREPRADIVGSSGSHGMYSRLKEVFRETKVQLLITQI